MLPQKKSAVDTTAHRLSRSAEYILVAVFGLLPLLYIPSLAAPLGFTKTLIVLVGVLVALMLFALSVLRAGTFTASFSLPLGALWTVAVAAAVSAILSGDVRDALIGDQFGIHTTAFVALLALVATTWMLLGRHKTTVLRLFLLLAFSTVVLAIYHVARLFTGAEVLSLGFFYNSTASPVGSWNDLALFLGISVLLSLVAFEQLSLTRPGRVFFGVVTVLALVMLAVIGFYAVWFVLAGASLIMLVYTLGNTHKNASVQPAELVHEKRGSSIPMLLVVFTTSVVFLLGGSVLGGMISSWTGLSYVEVRPSAASTVEIARGVYAENAFFGSGTNTFVDAWRTHKNDGINTSIFWNTDFNGGSGYIPTFFVTTGVVGGLAWLLFFGLFLVFGFRALLTSQSTDRTWYFIAAASFVSAVYVWGMSFVYIPGPAVLLLGALCTGLTFAARGALQSEKLTTWSIVQNGRVGFIATAAAIIVIVASVSTIYIAGRNYAAVYAFNTALVGEQQGLTLDEIEPRVAAAYTLAPSDVFVRRLAEYQAIRMNALLGVQEPTEADLQAFGAAQQTGIEAATEAVVRDPSEPQNWSTLGVIYGMLASAGLEGAYDRAHEALTRAKDLDPKNPNRLLALADLEVRADNIEAAREYTRQAIAQKSNYSDALFFLAQLDISEGNTAGAIDATRAIIALEPQNPARYYQLGILELSRENIEGAAAAFARAVELDTNYANARYFLALTYDALGETNAAKAQLEAVLALNPGNEQVLALLNLLEEEGTLGDILDNSTSAELEEGTSQIVEDNGTVTTTEEPDSTLVTPVNTIPDESATTDGENE